MAHRRTPPPLSQRTGYLEPDNDSDRDSGVGEDAGEDADSSHEATFTEEENVNIQDGLEENGGERRDFTVFVAFQGNMEDEDFARKLDTILSGIPNMLDMGSDRLQPQHVEPWNSVRVTFNIPRDAAERLRLLAQNNQQQLRDLGILSVQIEGEGAINVAVGPIRGQEVRVNGPIGGPGQMRMDVGFPGQPGTGGVRMANPAMVPPGPGMAAQAMMPGGSGQMHPRVPRPSSQTDVMDPMMPGIHQPPKEALPGESPHHKPKCFNVHPPLLQFKLPAIPHPLTHLAASKLGRYSMPWDRDNYSNNNSQEWVSLPPPSLKAHRLALEQGSPGTPPMMAQRPTTPQGFPQGVGSPGRAALGQQGNMQQGFMGMPQHGQPGAQVHPGMPKRPMGFPNPNFVQGQVSANTPGTPGGGAGQQLQSSQAMTHSGAPPASTPNSMQGPPHSQPNVMGIQSGMAGLPPGTTAGPSMGQQQQGLQTQIMGLQHQAQPVSSSPSQKVQGQGGGQTVLSRPLSQGQRGGMTPPKQMMLQQGQGVMHGQGQMMQGNKQAFGGKIPAGVMPGQMMRGPAPNVQGDPNSGTGDLGVQQMVPDIQAQQQQSMMAGAQHMQMGNGHFAGHGMNFNSQFPGQMPMGGPCAQQGGFPVNKDVTLTSPLLVNLLQSDISASQFGPGGKQGAGGGNQAKPKKKKPARKKKPKEGEGQQQVEGLGGLDGAAGMDDPELPNLGGEQNLGLENSSQKLPDFPNRPAVNVGFPGQPGDQRVLQQGLPNAQGQQGMTGPQTSATPATTATTADVDDAEVAAGAGKESYVHPSRGAAPPRGMGNPPEVQRLPVSQQGNMPVMISLQGHGGVPPSPDKARGMPLMVNPQLAGAARRMSHPEAGQGPQGSSSEEPIAGAHIKQDRPTGQEIGVQPGNGTQQMMANQGSNTTHMMKQGPGPSTMPQHTVASPQQQLPSQPQQAGPMPGLHFPNVPTTSQSSRPKTPNRASPRPYHHPLTPTNRPPSTEPSEINLSPERLNASIAGLFPPKINIPLPPRQPNLNRGFDQQGLNPTTLKAIGQAPPGLTLPGNNNNGSMGGNNTNNSQQPFSTGTGMGGAGTKQDKQPGGQGKRASPSNSRRSSPASSRKSATPSPGRPKGTKMAITCPPPQQQLVNPQGQTMMLSPSSVPPSPVSMHSQVSGSTEAQQTQSPFHGMQGNPAEGVRESQGMGAAEQRQLPQPHPQPQPLRELSAPRMASPRFPMPQQPKPDPEHQGGTVDRQPAHTAPNMQDSQVSPTLRAGPTSLNQLLDNSGIPIMPLRPIQSNTVRDLMGKDSPKSALDPRRPLHSNSQSTEITNTNATMSLSPNTVTSGQSSPASTVSTSSNSSAAQKPSPSPKPGTSVQSVIQIPASSSTMSPNQITVFVTSNPMTSAPTPQAPTTMASTMVAVPNKNIRPQDIRQQAPVPRPQFITTTTPVFINPIFQVPGGSVAPNTTMVPQPLTMVRPIQVSTTNIQLSTAPTSTQSSGANMGCTQPTRSIVGQVQVATSVSSSVPVGTPPASHQINPGPPKPENLSEAGSDHKPSPPVKQPSPNPSPSASSPFQPPLASPPLCSSPGAANNIRKSPMSPSPTALGKSKPAQVAAAVSGTADSQLSPVERSAQGPSGAVQPQTLHVPAIPATKIEAPNPHSAVAASNNMTPPAVSSPIPVPAHVAVPTQIVTQAPVTATASVSSKAQEVASQAAIVTVVSANTGTLLSAVAPVQSPVPSIVPIVAGSVPAMEVAPTTSPSVANPSGLPQVQPDAAVEPPMPPAAEFVETTQTTPAPIQQEVSQSQEPVASEKTGEEVSTSSEQGWAKKRKTPINLVPRAAVEKPKGPSRRSSRAEKEVEEEPVADSGIRKRSARPGTSAAVKETGASPTQAKRRKSK
ncbi:Nuclear receptor coactivator 6 [Dissostichus eleginoides]|uniref:Nuclear receptor coactivator 6 n=1 Tax=Dissostichus eleginoides TaxID=100907 RepID=A0AAD9CAJ6_DISEL|nr:Nuclear receptor coactivator 6 [Dissostichus eleginoides]